MSDTPPPVPSTPPTAPIPPSAAAPVAAPASPAPIVRSAAPVAAPRPDNQPVVPPPGAVVVHERELLPEGGAALVKLNFWQQPWVQNLLPMITSFVFHIAIITVGLLLVEPIREAIKPPQEQVIIPDATLVEGPVGGIPNPGLGGDPTRAAAQDQIKDVSSDGWSENKNKDLSQSLMAGGSTDASSDSVIGVGLKTTNARGSGNNLTGGGGGAQARYGIPGGGAGLGPKAPFMGVSGNAKRIAYVCDASGTMMSVFGTVQAELKKSIDKLSVVQAFNIFFFSANDVSTISKTGLLIASPGNKQTAFKFTDESRAAGPTNPIPAIKAAFAQKPELIYILTDGFDAIDDMNSVIQVFRDLNKDKKIKVQCILIRSREDKELERVLNTIASENGGTVKIISQGDL